MTTASGCSTSACSRPLTPSSASCTSWPDSSRRWRSICRASSLSSTTRMRRWAVPGAGAGVAARGRVAGSIRGKRTVNALPRPGPALVTSICPLWRSTRRLTSVSPMPRPAPARCRLVRPLDEQLEDSWEQISRNARPRVLHAQDRVGPLTHHGYYDPPVGGRELHGVVQEVQENLLEARFIGLDPEVVERVTGDVPPGRAGRHRRHGPLGGGAEIDRA